MAEKVRVFISWSGELSRKLGQAVTEWLPLALQFVEPYFTPEHIEKGTKWLPEISAKLDASELGIICLTRENLSNPWILFEAGALSRKPQSHVCTLLFDLEPTDVEFPLAMFQATPFTKDDVRKLVEAINTAGANLSLKESTLARAFDIAWPDLEGTVTKILAENGNVDEAERRTDRAILEEILELVRSALRRQEFTEAQKLSATELVEKTKRLAQQIAEAKSALALGKPSSTSASDSPEAEPSPSASPESCEDT